MKLLLEISYLGTRFAGFQVQPDKMTVQSALQDAIERVYGERYPVKGCSRTDAGVHALSYFVTYETEKNIAPEKIPMALNAALIPDISVKNARQVPDAFHVRHDVIEKEYEYRIRMNQMRDPFEVGRVCQLSHGLSEAELARMQAAAPAFPGTHDFSAFMAAGSKITDARRTVKHLEIFRENGDAVIRIAADGFLYNMVRIIAGTLIDVGKGRFSPEEMSEIIASRDRSRAGFTAPAEGLYLRQVVFRDGATELAGN